MATVPTRTSPRRGRRLWIVSALAALVLGGALIAASQLSVGRGSAVREAAALTPLRGVATSGFRLGAAGAPVTLTEYADLRCPVCAYFSTHVLADIIGRDVRSGLVKMVFVPWTILGPQSLLAHQALHAAALQHRAWAFAEVFYANQGPEDRDYVTPGFLRDVARTAGLDMSRFERDLARPNDYAAPILAADDRAQRLGLTGTPSVVVSGPGGREILPSGLPDPAALQQAIDRLAS